VEFISGDTSALASPRELANAHTLFNGINTVVFLVLLTPLVALVRRMVPERPQRTVDEGEATFLDEDVTGTATLGLSAVDREIDRLLGEVTDYFDAGFRACDLDDPWEDDSAFNDWVERGKDDIRQHQRAVVGYLGAVSTSARDEEQSTQLLAYVGEADELAHLTDLLASGFRRIHRRRHRHALTIPAETAEVLVRMQVTTSADLAAARTLPRPPTLQSDIESERELAGTRLARWFVRTKDVDAYVVVTDLLDLIDRVRISADRLAASPARQVNSG
jgi:phosphate:Na+ symporter